MLDTYSYIEKNIEKNTWINFKKCAESKNGVFFKIKFLSSIKKKFHMVSSQSFFSNRDLRDLRPLTPPRAKPLEAHESFFLKKWFFEKKIWKIRVGQASKNKKKKYRETLSLSLEVVHFLFRGGAFYLLEVVHFIWRGGAFYLLESTFHRILTKSKHQLKSVKRSLFNINMIKPELVFSVFIFERTLYSEMGQNIGLGPKDRPRNFRTFQ